MFLMFVWHINLIKTNKFDSRKAARKDEKSMKIQLLNAKNENLCLKGASRGIFKRKLCW